MKDRLCCYEICLVPDSVWGWHWDSREADEWEGATAQADEGSRHLAVQAASHARVVDNGVRRAVELRSELTGEKANGGLAVALLCVEKQLYTHRCSAGAQLPQARECLLELALISGGEARGCLLQL